MNECQIFLRKALDWHGKLSSPAFNWRRLRRGLVGLLVIFVSQQVMQAQSCGVNDGKEKQGTITKVERQPVSGEICGFPEFADPEADPPVEESCPPKYYGIMTEIFNLNITRTDDCSDSPLGFPSYLHRITTYQASFRKMTRKVKDEEGLCVEEIDGSGSSNYSRNTTAVLYDGSSWQDPGDGTGSSVYGALNGVYGWIETYPPEGEYPGGTVLADYPCFGDLYLNASCNVDTGKTVKHYYCDYSSPGYLCGHPANVVGQWEAISGDLTTFDIILSEELDCAAVAAEKIAQLGEEDWVAGGDVHAWLGWNGSSFSGQAVRYRVKFPCLSEDSVLEFTYRVWPTGEDEQANGWEEKETKTAGALGLQDTDDGQKEVKGFIEFTKCLNKRLIKVVKLGGCGGDGGGSSAGSSNGGSVSSMHWWVSLGKGEEGKSIGNLRVEENVMRAESATPARLKYDGGVNSQVKVIKDEGGGLQQVKAPECLADVHVLDATSYEIRFYHNGDFEPEMETVGTGGSAVQIATGRYVPTGMPFSVWKVENPDGGSVTNRVKISHTLGEGGEVYIFAQDSGGKWSLNEGDGQRTVEREETLLGNGDKQVVKEVRGSNNVVSYKAREVYHVFPWGERQIEEHEDPDGADLTTIWTYYDNATTDGGAYGLLKQVVNADGSWERYEYDAQGRETKKVATWLDGSPAASEGASRVTTTSWSQDGLTATIVETTAGTETGRRYWVKSVDGSQIQNITCTVAGAGIGAASNLTSVSTSIVSGEFKNKVASVANPDGTKSVYTYTHANGQYTTIEEHGAASANTVVAGRRTTTVEDELGNLVTREIRDIASGLVLESSTVIDRDEQNRPTRINYSDGTYEEKTYSCCGVESERDRDGVVTSYTYDELKRVLTETRNGLTTIFGYDGSGRVLTRTRKGGDGSEIVQETNTYDLAGRQTSSKDAVNPPTYFSEAFNGGGQRVKTTTLPNNSTRVETFHKDGQLVSVEGTGVHPLKYEYGTEGSGSYVKEIRVGDEGAETEWTKTTGDLVGRTLSRQSANGATTNLYYNSLGQLNREVDPDNVTLLYTYNSQGEREKTAVDMDRDGTIGGNDRVTITQRSVLSAHGATVERQETRVVNASGAEVVASREDMTPDGRQRWSESWGLPTTSTVNVTGNGTKTETIVLPDTSQIVRTYANGRLMGETVSGNGTTIRAVENSYDPHGRLQTSTDARNGTTTYTYDDLDRVRSVSAPENRSTGYEYDAMGRPTVTTLPDNTQTTNDYFPTGELKKTSGSQTYTVDYTYDSQGRMKTMTSSGQAGPSVTTMNYDAQSGLLTSKKDADNKGTAYTYTAGGRLQTRTWQRGVSTTYGYDNAGELLTVNYSDATPDVTYTRNRLGQITGISDGAGSRALTSSDDGRPLTESYSGGMFNGVATTIGYDSLKRRESYSLSAGGTTIPVGYGYGAASRLETVTSGTDAAGYSYLANSSLIGSVTQTRGGNTVLATAKAYDNANRLTNIGATSGGSTVSSHGYTYNALGQRTGVQLNDGTKWDYQYDGLGQVTAAGRKWGDNTAVAGQQYGYSYDGIGNRVGTTVNGRGAAYTANALNQYTQRVVPGALDILGSAVAGAKVTVNNQATVRKADYFYKALGIDNGSAAQYPQVTVIAVQNNMGPGGEDLVGEKSGHHYLPKTPETFSYDDDGNLLSDGRWSYAWDGENRLIAMESYASAPADSKKRLEFAYDGNSRRISKKVYAWNGSGYTPGEERRFLYDGWNLVAELAGNNTVQKSFLWGLDLSGSLQGAGGIGGLLAVQQGGESYYPAYDGNGNVMALIKASNQTVAARYHYGAFGEPIETFEEGDIDNPFRFSTKYHDKETGLAYYGYRFYNPVLGRWPNRDPIGEEGGVNLYAFCLNNAIDNSDVSGLLTLEEAEEHWRTGGGTPIHISLDEAVSDEVEIMDFPTVRAYIKGKSNGIFQIDDRKVYGTRGEVFYVLGTITLRLQGTLSLCGRGEIGTSRHYKFTGFMKSFADSYDFDMHSWLREPLRNVKTVVGRLHAGKGTKFLIFIDGKRNMDVSR